MQPASSPSLTAGSPPARRRGLVPAACVITLALVALSEISIAYYCEGMHLRWTRSDWGYKVWLSLEIKQAVADDPHSVFDVLVMGDSAAQMGISTPRITELTGMRAYNFGTHGVGSVLGSFSLIRSYALTHPGFKFLLIYFIPPFYDTANLDPAELFGLAGHNPRMTLQEFGLAPLLRLWIPSLRHQFVLKEGLKNPRSNFLWYDHNLRESMEAMMALKQGWLDGGDHRIRPLDVREWHNVFMGSQFFKRYLGKALRIAEDKGARPVIILPFLHPESQAEYVRARGDQQLREFLLKTTMNYPSTLVLDLNPILSDEDFQDNVHLTSGGAGKATAFISRFLKDDREDMPAGPERVGGTPRQ